MGKHYEYAITIKKDQWIKNHSLIFLLLIILLQKASTNYEEGFY